MTYFTAPLHEATEAVYDGNGDMLSPATHHGPGVGQAPYAGTPSIPGMRVYYSTGVPVPGPDTVLVTAPDGTVAKTGWVEKTQAEAQALFPLAGV